jgi:hypothetical protein
MDARIAGRAIYQGKRAAEIVSLKKKRVCGQQIKKINERMSKVYHTR